MRKNLTLPIVILAGAAAVCFLTDLVLINSQRAKHTVLAPYQLDIQLAGFAFVLLEGWLLRRNRQRQPV